MRKRIYKAPAELGCKKSFNATNPKFKVRNESSYTKMTFKFYAHTLIQKN